MCHRRVKVLLFGPARDTLNGITEIEVDMSHRNATVAGLRETLWDEFPPLRRVLVNSIFAMNNKMVTKLAEELTSLELGNLEIVLVPPVSGG